jgi:hypothetical protein
MSAMSAGIEKLKLGLERLAKAADDQDMQGAALTSLHGALEDRFRHLLATTPEVPEFDQARVLDVARVQWSDLLDLMRLHRGLSAEDATLIRTMNRERQSVAHGGRFRGKRVGLERYAQFVQSFFPEYQPAPPSLKQEPMPLGPEPSRPTRKQASTQPERPAVAADPTKVVPTRPPSRRSTSKPATKIAPAPQSPARINPGLALTMILLLIITCVAGMTLVQTENRAANPTAPTIAPPAPPLPTIAGIETRITSDALNLRSEPGIDGEFLVMMPAGATVTLLDQGPTRDGHLWVRVRFGEIEGWADSTFLQQP